MIERLAAISGKSSLTDWEKNFIGDLVQRAQDRGSDFSLSPKQEAIVAKIEKERKE